MKELIEKQAVIDALLSKMDTIDDKPDVVFGMAVAAGMIKDMPSALEQEFCDDCISRQAAIAVADYADYTGLAIEDVKIVTDEIVKGLKQLPSVTPAEKVGRWIDVDGIWFKCSKCGAHRKMMPAYKEYYCPNCGAKMSEIPTSCSTCILDRTDACTRGAGRAVDDEACEDYLASPTGTEGSDKK